MVAITVSAITVAVVVMVTIAALRPADSFSLSVVNGMDSSIKWLSKVNSSSSSSDADAATNTTMQRVAEKVNLTFALLAYNPSGRKDIRLGNITVRVTDMPLLPQLRQDEGHRSVPCARAVHPEAAGCAQVVEQVLPQRR
ncbi:hypothetical protein C2845_PM11G17620 [Panicum miliaceum]|uniref:Uncharacterized protein n=1 Tax=Panicum miliaceum TaxID=4540 RepID=A0A3L6RTL3_PANMI|nr:hypothetical protein C2845_PM11G17620 [Panicum miliaceum]